MEIKKIILVLTLLGIVFTYPLNYKIKYFGIHVADCSISSSNIKFDNYDAKKIIFKVKTKPFFRYLFPVDNNYELIINAKLKLVTVNESGKPIKIPLILEKKFTN